MTRSGPPAAEDEAPGQHGIWDLDEPEGQAAASGPTPVGEDAGTSLTQRLTSTTRAPGPAGVFLADVPNRVIALLVDILALSVVGFVLAWTLGGLVTERGAIDTGGGSLDVTAFLVVIVLEALLGFAYFAGLWSTTSMTLGMWLLGVRIVDAAQAQRIGRRSAIIRWLILGIPIWLASMGIYVPDVVGLVLAAVGSVGLLALLYTMAQSPTKQGLHDRYAHTILVKMRRRPS
jgi:uncharacterized RDD family membrane protein YckC